MPAPGARHGERSTRQAGWNEVVDVYDGIRRFDPGVAGIHATFDHATYNNARGCAEHSGTFLDGALTFLLHCAGTRAMTVGLSIMAGRRLQLQQVQLVSPHGNRWLFRLPSGGMEFVVDCLAGAFPRHRILVADGGAVAARNLADYRRGVQEF